jgi:hypothetical protein
MYIRIDVCIFIYLDIGGSGIFLLASIYKNVIYVYEMNVFILEYIGIHVYLFIYIYIFI